MISIMIQFSGSYTKWCQLKFHVANHTGVTEETNTFSAHSSVMCFFLKTNLEVCHVEIVSIMCVSFWKQT